MTIAHEHAFAVFNLLFTLSRGITVVDGVVFPTSLDRDRQPSRRVEFAKQQLCQRRAAFLTGVPGFEERWDVIHPRGHVHATTGSHDYDCVFVYGGDLMNEFILPGRQLERAVTTFAFIRGVKAHGQDDRIGSGSQ